MSCCSQKIKPTHNSNNNLQKKLVIWDVILVLALTNPSSRCRIGQPLLCDGYMDHNLNLYAMTETLVTGYFVDFDVCIYQRKYKDKNLNVQHLFVEIYDQTNN